MTRPYTQSVAGRQLDLEVLQTAGLPYGTRELGLTFTDTESRAVTGLQKLVQRFVLLLLTRYGDVKYAPETGTDFSTAMQNGVVRNPGRLGTVFALAASDAVAQMRNDDALTDSYGQIPDDERILSATLLDYEIDPVTLTLRIRFDISSVAGDNGVFVVPAAVVGG